MTSKLSEKAGVFLLELVFTGTTPKKGDLKPEYREPLRKDGLITIEKRGRVEVIVPTDAAWDWVAANLDLPLSRTRPTRALAGVLARLRDFLRTQDLALADFIRPAVGDAPEPPLASAADETRLAGRIRAAYLARTGGRFHERMRITDLRAALPDIEREALDGALRELSGKGKLALFPLDDRLEISLDDARDAVQLSGVPQHVIYLEG